MNSLLDKKDGSPSLEDICVRFVCKNLHLLTYSVKIESETRRRWRFPFQNFRISARPAQKILLQLCKRNALDDERMSLFSSEYLDLQSPIIKEASVGPSSLRVLREFHISNLSAMNLPNVSLNSLTGCLGEWTVRNLISLNVTGTSILCETNLPILVALGRFKNLQLLNVSRTEFTTANLQIVADDLPNLQHLNISRTRVTDIYPLLPMRDRLTGLVMHRLELDQREELEKMLSIIVQLHQLRTLDVSDKPRLTEARFDAIQKLCSAEALPHLMHIDLSGNQFGLRLEDARLLVENHPGLRFAGFASWLSNHEHELEGIHKLSQRFPDIVMLGDRGDQLLLNTLTRNKDRAVYLQNSLHSIFEATSNRESVKPDLLQAVLRVMRLHLRRMEMILAGTAVIYNLTRSEQSCQLPEELLNRAVRMTLTAMEKFPPNRQLQKNCFLTLCSDTVLYRATFNCNQCCELVFNYLIAFDDMHMRRMGVAIISILASEISTTGLSDLARDPRRIQCLLRYVAEKCLLASDMTDMGAAVPEYLTGFRLRTEGTPVFDTTLRFTLSALWNLTDECPDACMAFVREGGLIIYEKALKRFAEQDEEAKNHVFTKCLGLLNNVAEVEVTRQTLLIDSLMEFFFKMLRHPTIQISYFAAGIIAHLSCLKDELWSPSIQGSKESYVKLLGQCVCAWQPPQSEMVAYRSFEPFEQLVMHPQSRLEVHLWAIWAIHHILTRKEARYVPTLRDCSKLLNFLRYVISVEDTVLCAHSFQRQTPMMTSSTCSTASPTASVSIGPASLENDQLTFTQDMDLGLSTGQTAPFGLMMRHSESSQSAQITTAASSVGSSCPGGTSGDARTGDCSPTSPLDSIVTVSSGLPMFPAGKRISPTTVERSEPVQHTTVGLSAFVGPDSAQLQCARLIRSLAQEVVQVVDRCTPATPVTADPSSAGVVT